MNAREDGIKEVRRKVLDYLFAAFDASTSRERHGEGELVARNSIPQSASGCVLPDGSRVAATCLTCDRGIPEGERVWGRPLAPSSVVMRRGYVRVVPGVAIEFLDAPSTDVRAPEAGRTEQSGASLEDDLLRSDRVRALARGSGLFASLLYAALCNTSWVRRSDGAEDSFTWRSAGALVADVVGEGGYTDWYCSGSEGRVDEVVLAELQALGWDLFKADNPAGR